jgi:formylglycine-generating enzyme required for sulfatase activity
MFSIYNILNLYGGNKMKKIMLVLMMCVFFVACKQPSNSDSSTDEEMVFLSELPDSMTSENVGTLVGIPAGIFTMGQSGFDTLSHRVTLSAFLMSEFEITQEQYEKVMEYNPSIAQVYPIVPGEIAEKRPVEGVSWYDAIVFCNTLSIKEGLSPVYSIDGKTNLAEWGNVPTIDDATWNSVICNWNKNGYRLPTEAEWEQQHFLVTVLTQESMILLGMKEIMKLLFTK